MEQARPQYPLLSTEQIIKAGQVPNLAFLPPQQKLQAQQRVAALWEKLKNLPADNPEHMQAHRTLSDMSHAFKMRLTQWKAAQQQALAGQPPMSQAQANAAAAHVQAQIQQQQIAQNMATAQQTNNIAAGAAAQRQPQFSEKVRQEVSKFNPVIPPELRIRSAEEQKHWKNTQTMQYANLMRNWETASHNYEMFRKRASDARATMTPADIEKAKEDISKLKINLDAAQKAALTFKVTYDPAAAAAQQEQQRLQALRAQQQRNATAAAQQQSNPQPMKTEEKDHTAQVKAEDADGDVKIRPPTSGQDSANQQTPNAQQAIRPPPIPMPNATQASAISGQPTPLTHQAAIASARSYSQTAVPQQTPPGPAATPAITREPSAPSTSAMNNGVKPAPNRTLNVAPLTPAAMPASRPTMTGGQGLLGQQGQVALPKMPNVILPIEGEGRVLSRSKLMELVREVTGGAVGDGSEALDPDVEEMLLDVADEFVDNVATSACQLAKIRGSNTLDLRDVQLVIERNYNIRVPGFASDELRTVKRIIPTAAWAQKMSAIQAAKVTGGKGDA